MMPQRKRKNKGSEEDNSNLSGTPSRTRKRHMTRIWDLVPDKIPEFNQHVVCKNSQSEKNILLKSRNTQPLLLFKSQNSQDQQRTQPNMRMASGKAYFSESKCIPNFRRCNQSGINIVGKATITPAQSVNNSLSISAPILPSTLTNQPNKLRETTQKSSSKNSQRFTEPEIIILNDLPSSPPSVPTSMVEIQTGFQKLRNQRKLTQNHKGKQVWRADEDPGSSQSVYPLPKSLKHKNISSSLLKKIEFASSSSDPFEEKIDESPIEIIEIDSSSESSSDDELVESILLGRPPPTSTPNLILTSPSQSQPQSQSQSQPKRGPQPQHQPQPRFSPSDLRWMNVYFSKPVSTVLTTCSSLVVPPSAINGLPLDRLESLLAEDKWRIKREIISSPGNNQKIDCWVQADGWPAKTFKVCGWFVGVDRREKYLNYYVDDGTAVLECQISLSSAQSIFEERHTEKQSEEVLIYNSSHSKVHQNRDARLDAYIRPSSSPKKLSIQAPKEQQIKASEELIQKYANIMIGTTVQVTGQPKEMFRGLKRILEVESISFEDSNGEIKFRNELNKLRSTTYSQWPFRLSRAWPSFNSNYRECSISNGSSTFGNRTADFNVSVRSQPKHLRLPAARSLRLEQLNLPLFVTYLAHHINQNYIDKGKRTSGKQRISINELMKDPDLMEFAERLSNRLNPPTSQPAINIAGNSKFLNKQPQTARIRVNEPRRLFNKGIIKLVEQGVLIISVEDEKREEMFTLPDIYSLGPKLKELIQRNKAIRDLMVDDQLENGAGIDLILNDLKKDELWKYVTKDSVKSVLKQL